MSKKIEAPVIKEVDYNNLFVEELHQQIGSDNTKRKLLLEYPTVYIIHDQDSSNGYRVYVGETFDIERRTKQHLVDDPEKREDFKELANSANSRMYVIGHEHFNKSLTLDIENQLMMYLLSVDKVVYLNNRRTNAQNQYYTVDEMHPIINRIWGKLHQRNSTLFPLDSIIRDSAIFKASPFHKLTNEQIEAKNRIRAEISEILGESKDVSLVPNTTRTLGQVLLVEGGAGTGKTVLLSKLFYELNVASLESTSNPKAYLIVNHDEQLKVYEQIAKKLGLLHLDDDIVSKSTHFINSHKQKPPVDVILIDEAHLLLTQGKQSYRGKNQLDDLRKLAKVVVVVFDFHQILTTEEFWTQQAYDKLRGEAFDKISLHDQQRIDANQDTIDWINNLIFNRQVKKIPDDKKYQLLVGKSAESIYQAIKKHVSSKEIDQSGISRLLATYDWKYSNNKKNEDGGNWLVKDDNFSLPWNLQLSPEREYKDKAWAEQPQTINEVGSTYTIQGFDLNYAGVIIGPSVKYRDNKIIFDPSESQNAKAIRNRTLSDGRKINAAEELLQNELNVLLKRGVHGLFLYAVDPQLQKALLKAADSKKTAGNKHLID